MAKQTIERVRGRKLQQRRATHFRLWPLCVKCQENNKVSLATELDHIIPLFKGGSDEPTNLQGLCTSHHRDKTAIDLGHRQRVTIGADGWPITTKD